MILTPLEIRKKYFTMKLWGLNIDEVYQFISILAEELESLQRNNVYLKEQLTAATIALKQYKAMEQALRETELLVHEMFEDYQQIGHRQKELLFREAAIKQRALQTTLITKYLRLRNLAPNIMRSLNMKRRNAAAHRELSFDA